MWIYKSRNVLKKKEKGLMRILQAAYAWIMREKEVQYNKMIEGVVSVEAEWWESLSLY